MRRSILILVAISLSVLAFPLEADKRNQPKKIGIISGAGPRAGCKLYEKIINVCQECYNCNDNDKFPEIIIISYPFSTMLTPEARQKNKEKICKGLHHCFAKFEQEGVAISAIACNTLHTLLADGITVTPDFVHIAHCTLAYAQEKKLKKVLVLATQTTLELNLYASSKFVESITPDFSDQIIINGVIANILAGTVDQSDAQVLNKIIESYVHSHQIDGIILGCTELPLLHEAYPLEIASKKIIVLDTLEILAREIAKKSFGY